MCVFGMESFPGIGLRKTEINTAMLHYTGVCNEEAEHLLPAFPPGQELRRYLKISDLFCGKTALLMNSRKANKTPSPLRNKSFCFFYRLHVAFEAE